MALRRESPVLITAVSLLSPKDSAPVPIPLLPITGSRDGTDSRVLDSQALLPVRHIQIEERIFPMVRPARVLKGAIRSRITAELEAIRRQEPTCRETTMIYMAAWGILRFRFLHPDPIPKGKIPEGKQRMPRLVNQAYQAKNQRNAEPFGLEVKKEGKWKKSL